jgi:adenine phosphoribosyltransferase
MRSISIEDIKNSIRDVHDFPKKGILFKDLTTAFKDPEILVKLADELVFHYEEAGITKVVGIESRGFILGSILASRLGAGFVPIRKPGKLPAETYSISYELEYGVDSIEIHSDAIQPSDIVLLHDDLLATGGTSGAAISLLKQFKAEKIFLSFIVELSFLNGREKIDPDIEVFSLIRY